jgi:hypothetical protein
LRIPKRIWPAENAYRHAMPFPRKRGEPSMLCFLGIEQDLVRITICS